MYLFDKIPLQLLLSKRAVIPPHLESGSQKCVTDAQQNRGGQFMFLFDRLVVFNLVVCRGSLQRVPFTYFIVYEIFDGSVQFIRSSVAFKFSVCLPLIGAVADHYEFL